MLLRLVLGIGLLLTWSGPVFALGGGGGGNSGLGTVRVTNSPSASNQCLTSTSTTTAQWQSCAGGGGTLPSIPGTAGQILSENASAAVWVACSGDATCSAVTPGAFTVVAIRGNTVKAGTPTNAQLYVYNVTNVDLEPVSLSGDVTMTNAGVTTVASTHITGAVSGNLATFTATGNFANYAGASCSNQASTGLTTAGGISCVTITSNYVNTSIGTTGSDLSTASPTTIISTHITGANSGGIPKYTAGGGLGNATSGTDYAPATAGTTILKGNNLGGFAPAVSGTDYAPATTGVAIQKGNNLGGFNPAVAGTDYAAATTGSANIPLFANGAGGFTNGTRTGSTTQVMTFSGSATASKCIHTDISGNATVTAGDCGAVVGFVNTPTVTTGAATILAQCTSPGCVDYNRIANGANTGTLTLTTPAANAMSDGQELAVEVDMDGTHQPSSIAWTAGASVTLAYGNLGAGTTAALCGTAPATGYEMYNWVWNASTDKLTLHDCGPVPASTTLGIALGGTGGSSAALARSNLSAAQNGTNADITSLTGLTTPLPVNEGGTAATTAAGALTSLGAAESGVDINTSGQVTATHLAAALPVAQGGTGQTTLTSGAPLFGTGTSGITQGTLSGTGTELATFNGAATASRCLHTDASGNVTIAAGDCSVGTAATPGFINSPTVTAGAATLLAQCAAAGCTDYDRVANGTNVSTLTLTTPASGGMTNGQELAVEVDMDGTHAPTSIAWTAGSGVTLNYGALGNATTATACGTPIATGQELYRWGWNSTTGDLTLKYCSPVPGPTNLSVALGGTQCSATTIGTLPVTPPSGTTCLGITNAASCTAGTAVSTTGSTPCALSYINGAWYPAGGALSAAGAGFTTVGNGLTANGSQVSLTTPVTVAFGGTNATAAGATAAHNIGAAAQGANSDITSLTGLTTPLSVTQGGTAGTTKSAATANNIGAAALGANTDITSLGGLTTALSVAQGGTGQTALTANAPLFGNGTGGIAQGSRSGSTLEVATFNGAATASRCLHTDASGNVSITSTDCTAVSAPGFTTTPTVTPSGGNSTTTLTMSCGGAGCIDFQNVANAANSGTLTITFPASTGMVANQIIVVYAVDSGTAPTDILFGTAGAGVTYQSYVLGLASSDISSTAVGEATKRANACGVPQANGVILYQFWWDGANLNLTDCGGEPSRSTTPLALGGTNSSVGSLNNALQIPNDATTGTAVDKLVSLTTANPAAAIITPTGSMSGIVGICDSSLGTCGTTGTATIINYGDHNCVFDANGATAGHYVGASTITSGACADVGSMPAGGLLIIGRVYGSCAASADCKITFLPVSDILNNGGVSSAVTFNNLPNAVSGGTSVNHLAQITSSAMVTIGTTATAGVQGICTSNCGTSPPNPTIQVAGAVPCAVAATATPGDYAVADASNAGDCADGGSTFPVGGNEVVGTFLSTASGGKATVMLWGPDVANSSGSGGGGVNPPLKAGNAAYYASAATAISPVANTIYIHAYAGTSDPLHNAQAACPTNAACILQGTPGDTYNLASPFWLGIGLTIGNFFGPNGLNQTLMLNGATINLTDQTHEGTVGFPIDDGIIIGGRSRIYCWHGESGFALSHISPANNAWLNSVITSPAGVIENSWEASHAYLVGQVIYDGAATEYVSTAGTSGTPTHPTWATTPGATTPDGTGSLVWTVITDSTFASGRLTGRGQEYDIEGCRTAANVASTAHVNNVIRAGGVQGGKITILGDDVSSLSNETTKALGGTGGSDGLSGSIGIMIDPGQNSGFCTASGQPLPCCTGSTTGTCGTDVAGADNTCCGVIERTFLAPGTPSVATGPYAGLYLNSVDNIKILSDQWADIAGTGNAALAIVNASRAVTFDNNYFEVNSGAGAPTNGQMATGADALQIDNVHSFTESNDFFGKNGHSAITNCVHIEGASTYRVHLQGDGINLPCTNQVANDLSPGDNILGSGFGPAFDYDYSNPTTTSATPRAFNMFKTGYYMANAHCTGPAAPIACCTGLNAGNCTAVPTGTTVAAYEGAFICAADSDACTNGTAYSNSGLHATKCLLQFNAAGTAWSETGLNCF